MGTVEGVPNVKVQILGHAGAGSDLERILPEGAVGQGSAIVLHVAVFRADNPVPFVVVAVGEGDARVDVGVLEHLLGFALVDVARGRIDVVHVGQNELQRTSLGPEHKVNVFDVALKGVVDLLFRQKHQAHHPHAKSEQVQAQGRLQGLGPEIFQGLA